MDYEVRGEDQERIEMNETADALKEDDQSDMCNAEHICQLPLYKLSLYYSLTLYSTVTHTSDIPAAEFPNYVRLMHEDRDRTLDLEYKVCSLTELKALVTGQCAGWLQSLERLSQPASWVARLYYNADHNRFKKIFPCERTPLFIAS